LILVDNIFNNCGIFILQLIAVTFGGVRELTMVHLEAAVKTMGVIATAAIALSYLIYSRPNKVKDVRFEKTDELKC
jgi:hypothetical protein